MSRFAHPLQKNEANLRPNLFFNRISTSFAGSSLLTRALGSRTQLNLKDASQMDQKKYNEHFHVYVLVSTSDPFMVKIGKANNLKRALHFNKSGYAGITDWKQVLTLPTQSNESALALEAMICAKLTHKGFLRPKIMWTSKIISTRTVGATECYSCHIDHAIQVANEMARVHEEFVC